MAQAERGPLLAPGGWVSIGMIYLYGVFSTASLSKIIPILGDVGAHLGAPPARFGLLISLMTVLPALLASVAGSVIDRLGAQRALQLVAVIGVAVNGAYLATDSLSAFMAIRVLEGLIAVGAYAAAPALIMATTPAARRGRAMAVWSTYTPMGVSLGLLMSGSFAGTDTWRGGYWVHLVLFALLAASSPLLPRAPRAHAGTARHAGLFAAWGQRGPLRLSLTFATLIVMGFGVTTIYPQWFARAHAVPVGHASNILSLCTLLMIPSGFAAGALLARGRRDTVLLTTLLFAAVIISVPLFVPGLAEAGRVVTLLGWMVTQGALIAVVVAALPRVVENPLQGAAAAGLLSQLAALMTFVTPLIWQPLLQAGNWRGFLAVIAAGAVVARLLFPGGVARLRGPGSG
ncbi:MAG TPA: MFS transporter [Steroidobacteraceae bacterium]|nr:MFS transporter [Steroidobacteraceae bacterium]